MNQLEPVQLENLNRKVRNTVPYTSAAQRSYFNTNRRKLGDALVNEFNQASKGVRNLPEHVPDHSKPAKIRRLQAMTKVYKPKTQHVDLGGKGSFTVHKGALHEMMGIPEDQTIPKAREEAAAHQNSNPLLKRRAISALGFRAMK